MKLKKNILLLTIFSLIAIACGGAGASPVIAVQKGTTNYDKAVELVGEENVVAYDTFDFAVQAVISGDAVAALLDETAGLGYMGANSEDVKLVGEDLTSELLGFAFPDGSPLVDVINQGLAAMTESGKLNEINSAYFNPDFTLDYDGIAEDVGEASDATGTGPCSEVTISTGSNGLPDLGGCNMIIAVENAYIPFNYIDLADGKAKGWDYDVFNELSNLLNFVPVYTPASWDGMIQAVADGQFDIAGDGITITDERDKIIDFSDGYINIAQRIMVSTDSDIASLQDLLDYINN
ncbi:MAG: transporter substrate-binding domain-containing protein [Candidatus Actinomarina sp.]|jgi:ABC-type amino acid transport substrate-binding protein|nr:transporter substrate-binding domain-containing protein [Candidatus Actinomarina sp.]